MKLTKALKILIGALVALPINFFVGNELFANNQIDKFGYESYNENLLACGGGGGGASPAARAAKKAKQAKLKLNFKKRKLSEMAAAGEDTTKLQAEIAALEALLSE